MADGDIEVQVNAEDNASSLLEGIATGITIAFGEKLLDFVGGAFSFVTEQLGEFVSAAGEAEEVGALFNSVLDGSPLAEYGDELANLAQELQKTTRFEDEAILSAETIILRYNEIGHDVFPRVTATSLDLAESMKMTAEGGAQMLGRALSDIANGSLNALKRSRLLSQETIDLATAMAKAGDAEGAQTLILDALDKKIGNVAETMAGTFNGAMEKFGITIDNIRESLGSKLLPIFTPLVQKFQILAEKYAPILANVFDRFLVPALQKLVDVLNPLIDVAIPALMDLIQNLEHTSINWSDIFVNMANGITVLFDLLAGIDWGGIWNTVVEGLSGLGTGVSEAIAKIDWGQVGNAILDGLESLGDLWIGFQTALASAIDSIDFEKLSQDFAAGIRAVDWNALGVGIAGFVVDFWKGIAAGWENGGIQGALLKIDFGAVFGAVFDAIKGVVQGYWMRMWEEAAPTAVPFIVDAVNKISRTIETFLPNMVLTFQSNFEKIRLGIATSLALAVVTVVTQLAMIGNNLNSAVNGWISGLLERVGSFSQVGENMVNSIKAGIDGAMGAFIDYIGDIIDRAVAAALAALGLGGNEMATLEFGTTPGPETTGTQSGGAPGSSKKGGAGVTYNFGPVTQHFSGKPNTSVYGAG